MSLHSSLSPSHTDAGIATATSGLNEFPTTTAETGPPGAPSFFSKSSGKSPGHSLTAKVEKACRTFSPFGGSWDYSEVD